jgi:hypothetical protein
LGAIEDALKTEIDETTVLQKLAFKLAREIDLDSGGIAAFRELRTLLTVIKQDRSYLVFRGLCSERERLTRVVLGKVPAAAMG